MDRRELFGPDPRFAVTSPSVSATFSLPSSSLGSPPAFRWSHLPWKYSSLVHADAQRKRARRRPRQRYLRRLNGLSQIGQRQLQICQERHGLRYIHFDEMIWQQYPVDKEDWTQHQLGQPVAPSILFPVFNPPYPQGIIVYFQVGCDDSTSYKCS